MQINNNEIHIWSASLDISPEQEKNMVTLLSEDECERANRFHFSVHRQRFIAARGALRHLISFYLSIAPEDIIFSYTEHDKPYLSTPAHAVLRFNLSHSDIMAMYAFSVDTEVGIDIEKIKEQYPIGIVERFYSPKECEQLMQLPNKEQVRGFYRIWSRKEALIKATGKGLSIPLSSFSVSVTDVKEMITLDNKEWSLLPLLQQANYQAAVAIHRPLKLIHMKYCQFSFT